MMYANASVEITMEEKHNNLTEMQEFHGPNYEELKNLALLTFHMHSPAGKLNTLFWQGSQVLLMNYSEKELPTLLSAMID